MDLINVILVPVVLVYSLVMAVLLLYLFNLFYLAFIGLKKGRALLPRSPESIREWPRVTVQLPIYNELYVAERLIDSAAALDYPRDLLEIQVLDDSTDETVALVSRKVEELRLQGTNIHHLHRRERHGFKAGALARGLECASGEYLAIFDADFIPQADFLRLMLPHFDDERVAFVQARWGHLNRDYSMLTLLQSLSLDAHFAIDQLARSNSGYFFNFNGTAGIWRKSAVVDAGGWRADTLTEDMDLSYRAFLRGWSARYAGSVVVPAELPVSFMAYRRQQYRWARGSLECAIRYLPKIWRADLPPALKLQAALHLTGYGLHFITLALICLYPLLLVIAREYPSLLEPIGMGLIMNLFVFAPTAYFVIAQHILRRRWLTSVPMIFLASVFASGLVANTLRAALQILRRQSVPFERTPKYGIVTRGQSWSALRYGIRLDGLVLFELMLAALNVWTAWFGWQTGHFLIMTYAALFAAGFLFASGFTLVQSVTQRIRA